MLIGCFAVRGGALKEEQDRLNALIRMSDASDEPVRLTGDGHTGDRILFYEGTDGPVAEFRYADRTLWMTQAQIAGLFGRDQSVISRHINSVLDDGELDGESNMQKMHITGISKPTTLYSLDMIISAGYRVSSKQATIFRRWATDTLVRFATKGFVIDQARLRDAAALCLIMPRLACMRALRKETPDG